MVFAELSEKNAILQQDLEKLIHRSERSGAAFEFRVVTLVEANIEIPFITGWAILIITDGRKTGEGIGLGTGVPAYLDQGQSPAKWLVFRDDSEVLS